ncbi:MAG: hypothetical protein ACFFCP_11730 [Promethearchaeota archaeon]
MTHAKKLLTLASALLLVFLVAFPSFATTDAAMVLESPAAAAASVGDSFLIRARGRGGVQTIEREDFVVNYHTEMNLEFRIIRRGDRGVVLEVLGGTFSLNSTVYTFDAGLGFAGKPQNERFNGTELVFGFRINATSPTGESAETTIFGGVRRHHDIRPTLIMRGRIVISDTSIVFGQLGRIQRA